MTEYGVQSTENRGQRTEDGGRRTEDGKEKGAVLIVTFIVMATLIVITAAFLFMTSARLKGAGYDAASGKALWLAEAGLQQVKYRLKTEADYRSNPITVSGILGAGRYSVEVTKAGNNYTLISTGTVSVLNRRISETVTVTSSSLSGAMHSDAASIDFNGSNGTVNGNIEAKVHVENYGSMAINGTITEGIEQINPALDFDIYKTIAQSQGHYSSSALTFSNGTYSGVYYTTKGVTIGNNAVITGSIFAQGKIDFVDGADNISISPTDNYPALAAQGGISTNATGKPASRIGLQNSVINGLIYADSNISLNYLKNNVVINGTIVSDNNIDIQDSSDFTINYTAGIFVPMPLGFSFSGGDITIIPQKDWDEIG